MSHSKVDPLFEKQPQTDGALTCSLDKRFPIHLFEALCVVALTEVDFKPSGHLLFPPKSFYL